MRALACVIVVGSALLAGCEHEAESEPSSVSKRTAEQASPPVAEGPAEYVGRQRCGRCHAAQVDAHAGSHHDRAMQLADRETVAAPFADERLEARHTKARFVREEQHFVIEAGAELEVKWTFGVEPLQQYLVDTGRGRVQAFPAPFDTRPSARGGQRWYMQPELDVPEGDPLHWQGLVMNWNQSCADCHSTRVQKRYDFEQDRYETTFAEIDVSCEACHGPASVHVALAEHGPRALAARPAAGFERVLSAPSARRWVRAEGEPIARLQGVKAPEVGAAHVSDELDTCARCHSRRSDLGGESLRFHDRYRLQLIEPPFYFADGQIREEVYVYGSFLQSAMYRAGVVCSDCHEPHAATLRAPAQQLCARCHDPARFDVPAHHMHPAAVEPSPSCVDCHMPARTYMEVDARRDHRLGVPRPDLSEALGTPNACQSCHRERDAAWLTAAIAKSHGSERPATPWPTLHALDAMPDESAQRAVSRLVADRSQAPLVRASALVRWSRAGGPGRALVEAVARSARSVHPVLRRAAAEASAALPPALRVQLLAPLWEDPRRVVRFEAVMAHLGGSPHSGAPEPSGFLAALREARQARMQDADTLEGLLALGAMTLRLGEPARAFTFFERAADRFAYSDQPFVNWADALRAAGDEARAGRVLAQGLARHPGSAPLHHARGLWLVRQGEHEEALAALRRAVQLADEGNRGRFEYVYEVARRDVQAKAGDAPSAHER